ncbi:hypothetical protein C8F04DRAFT_1197593 [Mycena alexandri]|uniref:Uncharacterized protein n=1 Tax=Mycena alexandri TaxID=1745969 RepID=A0AAD6S2V7_9AGAR|nr:hypothetical protein C8F04DRAFT_1197593 [Mycena alexandri]
MSSVTSLLAKFEFVSFKQRGFRTRFGLVFLSTYSSLGSLLPSRTLGPAFWTGVFVDPSIPLAVIGRCSDNSGSRSTDLVLDLANNTEFPLAALWNTLRPVLHRCRTLSVRVRDAESWLLLDAEIQDARVDRLESCVLQIEHDVSDQIAVHPVFLRLGDGFIRKVAHLCLHGISLEWSSRHNFSLLSSLTIIDPAFSPSWSDYRIIATNAGTLRRLCLRNAGCSDSPADLSDVIDFPCLDELDYSFGNRSPSSSLFIRHCSMPSLRVLRFHAEQPGHLMALAFCATMLSTVETLRLSGAVEDDGFAYFLFIRLPLLRFLELPTTDGSFLHAILVADSRLGRQVPPEGPACPLLTRVRVLGGSLSLLHQFVWRRRSSDAKNLEAVEFSVESFSELDVTELHVLNAEVEVLAVGADTEEPHWITGMGDLNGLG